ncbi:MAG TPA: DUF899 family protein [Bryobacteraceae bacterium]|nr:DUF899 family protein [Bryobacteraceae bacterium]
MANLIPVQQLVATNKSHYPNESAEYRAARNALLAEEIELRRHLERVAEQRRALPPGGAIPKDFDFIGPGGPLHLSDLFGDKDTLLVYSLMFGPQRAAACPMCTSFLTSWNGSAVNLRERVALAVTARSPIARLLDFQKQRNLMNLRFLSDTSGDYTRTYVSAEDADMPGFSVFVRRDGVIRHFYSPEMSFDMSDPGQDPRGAPDMDMLWQMLDYTPDGRGADWYPKLDYGHK